MENKIFYIILESITHPHRQKDKIEASYTNGIDKITKAYKIGEDIKTIINIDEE